MTSHSTTAIIPQTKPAIAIPIPPAVPALTFLRARVEKTMAKASGIAPNIHTHGVMLITAPDIPSTNPVIANPFGPSAPNACAGIAG
jgi:hypothetical protein